MTRSLAPLALFWLTLVGSACGSGHNGAPAASEDRGGSNVPVPAPMLARASRSEQEAGLERCASFLESVRAEAPPSFAVTMRECAGLFAATPCRVALAAADFSRFEVHSACSSAYCDGLASPRPSFCTREMPSDAEFLEQFAEFTEIVLDRDLQALLGSEGGRDVASLVGALIRAQARQ